MPFFCNFTKWNWRSKYKVLAFGSQWRCHCQIQVTRSLYHKNQILKFPPPSLIPALRNISRHFTVETGQTEYTFATQCTEVRFSSFLPGRFITAIVKCVQKKSRLTNCRFTSISSQISAIYMNIFHKTEVQTVILRCWMGLYLT